MLDVLRSVGAEVTVGAAGPGSVAVDARRLSSASPDAAAVQAGAYTRPLQRST
jgi:hypothetical protein